MELPPARSLQSCIKIHGLDHWVKNPRKEDGSSWAHHEGVEGEGCPWAAAGASLLPLLHLLQSFHQCLPSLASRVLACSRVSGERECVANERMSERVALAEKYLFPFVLTCGSHPLKWRTTHFPLTVAALCWRSLTSFINRQYNLHIYLISSPNIGLGV